MIELHDSTGSLVIIEPGQIVAAFPRSDGSGGSSLKLRDDPAGLIFAVKESVTEIRDMLEAADAGDETPEPQP